MWSRRCAVAALAFAACLGRSENIAMTEGAAAAPGTPQVAPLDPGNGGHGGDANADAGGAPTSAGDGNLTFLGRTLALDPNHPDHVALAWAGVAVGATVEATRVTAHFVPTGLPPPKVTTTGLLPPVRQSVYRLYVDGAMVRDFSVVHQAERDVVLVDALSPGPHTLWVVKRSEAWIGTNGFAGLSLDANGRFLSPPARPASAIEIVGASVDTGFGVLGANCHPTLSTCQDVEQSWGNLVGRALGREVVNLSYSGHGLEWANGGPYPPGYSPAAYYLETDVTAIGHPWDANRRQVDAVLFGLFANDWYFAPPNQSDFEGQLTAFIATIRALHPTAHVYLTMSSTMEAATRPTLGAYLQNVVDAQRAAGDTRVHQVAFPPVVGKGCDGHPDVAQQQAMADIFLPIIRADLDL